MELNEKFNIIFYNRGVGGFITDELGINDLSYPDIPIAQMIDHYDQILCQVKAALLLVRTNQKIAEANAAVKKLAEKHHAKYIDINDPLKDENGNLKAEYTIEGMHIKEEGYRAIFPEFIRYAME